MGLISHQICVQGPGAVEVLGGSSTSCVREELSASREPLGMRMSALWVGRALGPSSGMCTGRRGTSLARELLGCGPNSSWSGLNPPPRCLQQLLGKEPGGSCSSSCRRHPQSCGITPSPQAVGEALGARWDLCGVTESLQALRNFLPTSPHLCSCPLLPEPALPQGSAAGKPTLNYGGLSIRRLPGETSWRPG